jgi:hypothetical protein
MSSNTSNAPPGKIKIIISFSRSKVESYFGDLESDWWRSWQASPWPEYGSNKYARGQSRGTSPSQDESE